MGTVSRFHMGHFWTHKTFWTINNLKCNIAVPWYIIWNIEVRAQVVDSQELVEAIWNTEHPSEQAVCYLHMKGDKSHLPFMNIDRALMALIRNNQSNHRSDLLLKRKVIDLVQDLLAIRNWRHIWSILVCTTQTLSCYIYIILT